MVDLDKLKEKAQSEAVGINLVLKEYIHFLVLEYLFKSGHFSHLVFQGGTTLRFAYGGIRYSEDLDFVLRQKDNKFLDSLIKGMNHLPGHIDKFLPFARNVQLKIQKDTSEFKRFILALEVETMVAKDKTHIEILNIPSYDNRTIIIRREDIPISPAITVESPEELLSDKFMALGSRKYLKGRDIWDIYFLLNTLKVSLTKDILKMVQKKIIDYHTDYKEFSLRFKNSIEVLKEKGSYILKQEMDKFLPVFYRKSFEGNYKNISQDVLNASLWVKDEIKP